MNRFNLLIIEDEKGTADFIKQVVSDNCMMFQVAGLANSVQTGIKLIEKEKPDLIILDVDLGDGTAFDLLKKTDHQSFITIFLTAYQGYALQAIKFAAFDYLLKPFRPTELVETLKRAYSFAKQKKDINKISVKTLLDNVSTNNIQEKKILLRTGSDIHLVMVKDIVYCKADSSYTHFILTDNETITVSVNLKEYEAMLEEYGFIRSHHSYLANLHNIKRYHKIGQAYLLMTNGDKIPVSARSKEKLFSLFKKNY